MFISSLVPVPPVAVLIKVFQRAVQTQAKVRKTPYTRFHLEWTSPSATVSGYLAHTPVVIIATRSIYNMGYHGSITKRLQTRIARLGGIWAKERVRSRGQFGDVEWEYRHSKGFFNVLRVPPAAHPPQTNRLHPRLAPAQLALRPRPAVPHRT